MPSPVTVILFSAFSDKYNRLGRVKQHQDSYSILVQKGKIARVLATEATGKGGHRKSLKRLYLAVIRSFIRERFSIETTLGQLNFHT
ncbi:MAG: hypothetical protein RW306_14210 [Geobacteraceae bacterium]|nr:hypothetical protein [Geobacteraceae bacterium]